ncbi:hypothetical protein [Streptomyces aureocirculatus]|uniref:hypothetical protein n=1 Tax=Streptomyces aureocirculatus TaxID=67275 RepID=UPI00099B7E7B|nr:hypothetical protein [Streptomyces aureocirculatus]
MNRSRSRDRSSSGSGRPRRRGPVRRGAPAAAAVLALSAAALAGCGDPGDLRGAGTTPTAVGPTRLWPDLPPASSPVGDYGEADTEVVKGVRVPGGDLRKVDPLAVVRAEVAANPDVYSGPDALYKETVRALKDCGDRSEDCPVLKAYYRDFTGDGSDDLVIGIRMPEEQLAVRVYAMEKGLLTQIMGTSDAVLGVELAGRALVVRAVSGIPGYEYRTAWSWDRHQRAMLPTRDEILRSSDAPRSKGVRSQAPALTEGPEPAPGPGETSGPAAPAPAPGESRRPTPGPSGGDGTDGGT